MRVGRLFVALAGSVCALGISVRDAHSFEGGIVAFSGKNVATCLSCHQPPFGIPPRVSFEAPGGTVMQIGEMATFRFRIESRVESQRTAGFNVASNGGMLAVSEAGVRAESFLMSVELTHEQPRDSDASGVTIFEFTWRAPDTPGTYTLFGAGNSVNGNRTTSGDYSATTTIEITVMGPPTATPTRTATPSNTPTPTRTSTRTPTAMPTEPQLCVGDCDGSGDVTVDEIVTGVAIALGNRPAGDCPNFDRDESGTVTVDEIVEAIRNALNGC